MKIDKIILSNLASIEGEQTIDFTQEPLRSAGLFAITGDTGAGKSTLLDAICLALYNRAPRFDEAEKLSGTDWKENDEADRQLQTNDVRNLLRRGQKEGFARVVFTTLDGARYQAEWRLRIKRTGTYDKVARSLVMLSPRKETFPTAEIDQRIVKIVGLDYLQFTRTVILAQNSFANFLKAKKADKSALLEKLTGTEIYARISQRIYAQNEEARRAVENIENQVVGVLQNRLEEEELVEMQEKQQLLQTSLASTQEEINQLEKQLQWYAHVEKAEQGVRSAEAAHDKAYAAYVALRSDELQLKRYDEVLCVQPVFQEIVVRQADIHFIEQEEEAAKQKCEVLQKELYDVQQLHKKNQQDAAQAEGNLRKRRPSLNRGHALCGEIKESKERLQKAEEQLREAEQSYEQQQQISQAKHLQFEELQQDNERNLLHKQALDVHKLLFEKIDLVKDKLSLLNAETQRNAENHKKYDELKKKCTELTKSMDQAEKSFQSSQDRLSALRSELALHRNYNQGRDGSSLQQQFSKQNLRLQMLEQAATLWARISNGYEEIAEKRSAQSRRKAEQEQTIKDVEQLNAQIATISEEHQRLHTAFTLSQSQNIISLRKQLKEGSACPLCGATHHPYHTETERELGELLNNLEKDYTEVSERLEKKKEKLNELKEKFATTDGRIKAEAENLLEREQQQQIDVQQWKSYAELDPSFADCSERVNRDARRLLIEMLADSTQKMAAEAEKELNDYNQHQSRINQINEDIAVISHKTDEESVALEDLRTQFQISTAAADDLQQTMNISDRLCAQLYTDLDAMITLSGWFTEWKNNPDSLRLRLADLHNDWLTTNKELDNGSRSEALLREEIKSVERAETEAQRRRNYARVQKESSEELLRNKENELKELFADRTPEEEEETLLREIERTKAAEAESKLKSEKAASAVDSLGGALLSLKQRKADKQSELREKMSELDLWILKFNGNHPPIQFKELERIFTDKRNWNALRSHIDTIKQQQKLAAHQLEQERGELLALQSMPGRPNAAEGETRAALMEQHALKKSKQENLQTEQARVNLRLMAHQQSLQQASRFEEKLKQARHNALQWNRLSSLLGSADGKKFREMAQSYTFEYLVEHANVHLRQLSPRYELRTVAGTLTPEIVDRDMFDQHRFVHSLSGGETFLVSLSLALGLASLSSGNLSIGSLFIDEGFGNLDHDSLQIVMDALARLENTQGRKVGVISHTQQIRSQISPQIQLVKQPGGGKSTLKIV